MGLGAGGGGGGFGEDLNNGAIHGLFYLILGIGGLFCRCTGLIVPEGFTTVFTMQDCLQNPQAKR